MLGGGEEVGELLQGQGSTYRLYSQSSLRQWRTMSEDVGMTILTLIIAGFAGLGAVDVLASKFGAEDRPGFDERAPLN